jgi:L-lactate utilization protein LutB
VSRLQQIATLRQGLIGKGDLAQRVAAIRENTVAKLPELTAAATGMLEKKLAKVYQAKDGSAAAEIIINLLKGQKQVARAYSNTLAEIGFEDLLAREGVTVYPTRLEEIVCREAGLPAGGHPHLAALDQPKEAIATALKHYIGRQDIAAPAEIVAIAREKVKETILGCEYGVTGANCIVAENGVLVAAEDEGNVRAVSNLPYKHLAVVGIDKIIASAEDAMAVLRATAIYGVGRITPTYFSLIAGPSRTADIEFRMAYGMHGPKEVHIVFLDNGRLAIREQGAGALLKCINCGACFESCAALAEQQGWRNEVLTPKSLALAIVQGRIPAAGGNPRMAEFVCPVGLSAKMVADKLATLATI